MRPILFFSIILSLGVALRINEYARNRALWHDEARFANSLAEPSWRATRAREFARPLAFLSASRWLREKLGDEEWVVRLLPFLASVAACFLFAWLAYLCSDSVAPLFSLALFSLSPTLLYFSAEAKHYSWDVMLAILLLALWEWARRLPRVASIWALAAVGALAPWWGFGAALVAVPVSLLALRYAVIESGAMRGAWAAVFVLPLLSLALAGSFIGGGESFLSSYWAPHFPSLSRALPRWLVTHGEWVATLTLGLPSAALALVLGAAGAWAVWWRDPERLFAWLSPLGLAAVLCIVGKYPFYERLLLFCAPGAFLCLAEGFRWLWDAPRRARAMGVAMGAVLLLPLTGQAAMRLWHGHPRQELRSVLQSLCHEYRAGDRLYLYYGAAEAFRYYAPRVGLSVDAADVGVRSREDWQGYVKDLERLKGERRVWVIFTRVFDRFGTDEEKLMLHHLDSWGHQKLAIREIGASAYLYDLKPSLPAGAVGQKEPPGEVGPPPRTASTPKSPLGGT